jgi:hypothetical protein
MVICCWQHTCTSFINISSSPPLHHFHCLWRHITLPCRAIKSLKPQFKFRPCCTICIILFSFSGTQKSIFSQRKTFCLQNSVFHALSSITVCVKKHNVDAPIMSFIKCKWGSIELQSKQEEEEIEYCWLIYAMKTNALSCWKLCSCSWRYISKTSVSLACLSVTKWGENSLFVWR